jgi:BolA protein
MKTISNLCCTHGHSTLYTNGIKNLPSLKDYVMGPVAQEITNRLEHRFAPTQLSVQDDSLSHHGHAGYREGIETHLTIQIKSPSFAGLSRLARQRLVLEVVQDLMDNPIHALVIKAE